MTFGDTWSVVQELHGNHTRTSKKFPLEIEADNSWVFLGFSLKCKGIAPGHLTPAIISTQCCQRKESAKRRADVLSQYKALDLSALSFMCWNVSFTGQTETLSNYSPRY